MERFLAGEPGRYARVSASRIDDVAKAFAQLADLKSVWTLGHSVGVAAIATKAAEASGLGENERDVLRRAALLRGREEGSLLDTTKRYGEFYNAKLAASQRRQYRDKGPNPWTATLIEALKAEGVAGATLLDIGGGIGAIHHELLATGSIRSMRSTGSSVNAGSPGNLLEAFERRGTWQSTDVCEAAKMDARSSDALLAAAQAGDLDIAWRVFTENGADRAWDSGARQAKARTCGRGAPRVAATRISSSSTNG